MWWKKKNSRVGFLTRTAMLGAVASITPSSISGRSGTNTFSRRTNMPQLISYGFNNISNEHQM
jgi:hypothetical protein